MAETITHTWQTVEQAAVTLNCSTRTIARRLSGGGLESRVDENGRRLVLVQQVSDVGSDIGLVTAADDALAGPEAPAHAPAQPSEQAMSIFNALQTTLADARDDARSARVSAKWAWAGVGLMAVALMAGAAVISGTVTKAVVTEDLLRGQLAETKTDLKQTQAELMATRTAEAQATRDLTDARRSAEQQRQTATVIAPATPAAPTSPVATPAARPATQPTLMDRVVSLFGE